MPLLQSNAMHDYMAIGLIIAVTTGGTRVIVNNTLT